MRVNGDDGFFQDVVLVDDIDAHLVARSAARQVQRRKIASARAESANAKPESHAIVELGRNS